MMGDINMSESIKDGQRFIENIIPYYKKAMYTSKVVLASTKDSI